jgi:endonuclease-3
MLSSQTKDEVTHAAIANLRASFGGSISLNAMIEADDKVIADAISKVGFWRKKTVFVIIIFTFFSHCTKFIKIHI